MERSVMESTVVYAVIEQQLGSSTDGLIAAVFTDSDAADTHVTRLLHSPSDSQDRVWRVSESPVRSLLEVSENLRMLFVVYESDEDGIRPLHLYASERLAQRKVHECQSDDQIRRLTDELSGQINSPKSYWWECCPVLGHSQHEGRIHASLIVTHSKLNGNVCRQRSERHTVNAFMTSVRKGSATRIDSIRC